MKTTTLPQSVKEIVTLISSSSRVRLVILGMTLLLAALAVLASLATPRAFASQTSTQNTSWLGSPEGKFQRTRIAPEGIPGPLKLEETNQAGAVPESLTANALINNNNGSTGTSFFTQSETSLVAFGNTIVAGFNDSGSNAGITNHFTGWSRSTDGGTTWTDGGTLPASAAGDAGDPVLARDSTSGRIYFATLGFTNSNVIQVFRSTDNGATWLAPVNGTPGGSDEDKEWITVDNFPGAGNGNVYLVSRRFGAGPGIYHFRSTDGGATWGPSGGTPIVSGNQGAFVTVSPNHSVHVFWYAGTTLQVRKSTDQGVTWNAPSTVASGLIGGSNGDLGLTGLRQGTATFSLFRTNEFPHAVVNPVSGNIYVTYDNDGPGSDKADVFFVQSTDGGATWSAPMRVNDDATTTDQWMPTIVVSPTGDRLGVFYYSRQEDPANNNLFKRYGRIASISAGTITFTPSFAVSDTASLPEFGRDSVVNSTYMGDYDQVVATPGVFHIVWSDNRSDLPGGAPRKDPNVYYNKIGSPPGPCDFRVLIVYADNSGPPAQLQSQILAEPNVTAVDLFDATAGTPTLAQLQNYNIVVPFSNSQFSDGATLGDRLADYVDGGGIVVQYGFSHYGPGQPFGINGRWVTGNYNPYNYSTNVVSTPFTLGSFNAGHPLMAGVTTLNSDFQNVVTLAAGSTQAAAASNGNSLVAFRPVSGGHTTVGVTAYVGAASTQSGHWGKVVVNAGNWLLGCGWRLPAVGDFNGDSKPDYVLHNARTRQTAVWFMNNNIFVSGAYGPTLSTGFTLVGVADFNGDGKRDYLLLNPNTRQSAIWYLSGVTFLGGAYGPTLPSGWILMATGDFNGNSKPDYVLYNTSTRQTAVWYMNNAVFVSGAFGPTLPVGWSLVGVADFNGDGKLDYLLFNPSTRQSAIWYLSGVTFLGGAFGPTLPSGWQLVATADFNGNGKPDYVLYNVNTRQTAIWYLNNAVFVNGAFGPTLPSG
jgi:FG-GAP-like repeat